MADENEICPGFYAEGGFGVASLADIADLTGLEVIERLQSGQLPAPPMSKTLGFGLHEVEEGRVVFKGMPKEAYLNPLGTVHGGWAASIMDSAMACCVQTTLRKGEAYTTTEFKVNLIRPIVPTTGEVFCEGLVVSRGRTIAVAECRLRDTRQRVLAFGTETCSIFPISSMKREAS